MAVPGRKLRWLVEKFGTGKKLARRGCFAVYVGEERERREIPAKYLRSIMLRALLDQCRDQPDESNGLYLCCSPCLLDWVLELAKAEVEETDPHPAIKRDGIVPANRLPMRSFSNCIIVV